jgi:hypothetical protein
MSICSDPVGPGAFKRGTGLVGFAREGSPLVAFRYIKRRCKVSGPRGFLNLYSFVERIVSRDRINLVAPSAVELP